MTEPLTLTSSELKSWQTCPRGWWLTQYRGMRRKHEFGSLPNIGTLVHLGLEHYYGAEEDPEFSPSAIVAERVAKVAAELPMYEDQIKKDGELATIMLDGYVEHVEATGIDAGLEFAGSEVHTSAQIGPYILQGKIDARMRRTIDGALLQLEHKTVGNLAEIPKYAQGAMQFLNYDLLAHLTKPDGVGTDGIVINMLRRVKRTASAKPPFYGRHEVRHNLDELRNHYRHVVALGDQISAAREALDGGASHHDVCPPNITRSHTFSCSCHEVTEMFDNGSDVEAFLEEFWEVTDPMARYHEDDAPER